VDSIVHAAAEVKFNQNYSSLKAANVESVIEFVELASKIKKKSIYYISSISSSLRNPTEIPESLNVPSSSAIAMGYAQTKWVAEQVLGQAAIDGLSISIFRVGYIAGNSRTGIWHDSDTMPILIQECSQLGIFPSFPITIDWVPVDIVSRFVVSSLNNTRKEINPYVFNMLNPEKTPWKVLEDVVSKQVPNITICQSDVFLKKLDSLIEAKIISNLTVLRPTFESFTFGEMLPPCNLTSFVKEPVQPISASLLELYVKRLIKSQ